MATVKYHLNHPYEKKTKVFKKEEVSIDLIFTIDRDHRFPLATGERIQPKYWNKDEKCVKSTYTGHHEINRRLVQMKERVMTAYGEWKHSGKAFDDLKAAIRVAVKGNAVVQKKTLFQALELFLNECEDNKGKNTVKMYRSLRAKLLDFNDKYPIDFNNLDLNFYDAFKRYLYLVPNPAYVDHRLVADAGGDCFHIVRTPYGGGNIGLFDDTVFKYIINLSAFLSWASERDYPVERSFERWQIIRRSYPAISLTKDELERLESTPMDGVMAIARDYLALECRTAARISDLQRFDIKQVNDNVWTYTPKKTARLHATQIKLPFTGYCAPAWWILQRYNFRMPKIAEQTINRNIKEACNLAGIDSEISITRWIGSKKVVIPGKKWEYITTHTGKKTFITILAENNVPLKVISDLSGTSVQTIIKHYLAKSDAKVIDNYLNQVQGDIPLMRKTS